MWAFATAKTKSALKRCWAIVLLCLFVALVIGIAFLSFSAPPPRTTQAKIAKKKYTLQVVASPGTTLHGRLYYLNAATSGKERAIGLSGQETMANDHGMLFVYQSTDTHCFWMKDMRFALDIIWLDADTKVTHVETNLQPDSYPQQYCAVGRYAVELRAGQAAEAGIVVGQKLSL